IYRRLDDVTPGAFERNRAVTLNKLAVTLVECRDWAGALNVTEETIPLLRRLAAEEPLIFDFALGRSLTRLALAHDKADNPSDDALAPAGESIGIFRRLVATSPGAAQPMRQASLALEGLLLTRDRLLLTHERAVFHRLRDLRVSICDQLAGPA